ncbi:hypothetical protein OOU_Y34scaffold00590g31 [Pyricularia oryzae Y34]|uniref:Secreted protein n=1 Tax=Pyricularia oryzae (strain Y34) TaxID=1143189 RepID=A0AA97PK11_PYRO3|nr:hypothetical protein OOU_Y34scaffold00590g31 [Pyricularia oryzae Y34]
MSGGHLICYAVVIFPEAVVILYTELPCWVVCIRFGGEVTIVHRQAASNCYQLRSLRGGKPQDGRVTGISRPLRRKLGRSNSALGPSGLPNLILLQYQQTVVHPRIKDGAGCRRRETARVPPLYSRGTPPSGSYESTWCSSPPSALFPQKLNSGFLQSQHSRGPWTTTRPKWATALP